MKIDYDRFGAPDLRGRTLADFLINVEADLKIVEGDEVVYSERSFPVAELARELNQWMEEAGEVPPEDGFCFQSLSFEEPGAVVVSQVGSGWIVGSSLEPGKITRILAWTDLRVTISDFIDKVRRDLVGIGLDPRIIDK
ncbi:hypothetical protein [Streptomyces sp. NRRL F-5123]|uniref:DUF7878 domain-containing protein n=1 Tax=Streptomyces sp. NRRL F-5123 TaxID=1463856 RepID=UPI000693B4FB|nr:hypothetical protein [Streptomyces sp. NRRL F-5123]